VNEAEVRTYGLVAQAIAKHAFAWADTDTAQGYYDSKFPEAPRPIFYHVSMSTLEAVADDLWRLGILKPLDRIGPLDQQGWAYHFAFDCKISESNIVAERNWPNGPTLIELLATFIGLFGEYGTEYWGFSTKPNVTFGANSRIMPTLEALASLGYLFKTNGGYVWTELIAPIMREAYWFDDWPAP
jgi:hypothetical protein